jgi:hypothetical protein
MSLRYMSDDWGARTGGEGDRAFLDEQGARYWLMR